MVHDQQKAPTSTWMVVAIVVVIALLIAGIAAIAVMMLGTRFRIVGDEIYIYE